MAEMQFVITAVNQMDKPLQEIRQGFSEAEKQLKSLSSAAEVMSQRLQDGTGAMNAQLSAMSSQLRVGGAQVQTLLPALGKVKSSAQEMATVIGGTRGMWMQSQTDAANTARAMGIVADKKREAANATTLYGTVLDTLKQQSTDTDAILRQMGGTVRYNTDGTIAWKDSLESSVQGQIAARDSTGQLTQAYQRMREEIERAKQAQAGASGLNFKGALGAGAAVGGTAAASTILAGGSTEDAAKAFALGAVPAVLGNVIAQLGGVQVVVANIMSYATAGIAAIASKIGMVSGLATMSVGAVSASLGVIAAGVVAWGYSLSKIPDLYRAIRDAQGGVAEQGDKDRKRLAQLDADAAKAKESITAEDAAGMSWQELTDESTRQLANRESNIIGLTDAMQKLGIVQKEGQSLEDAALASGNKALVQYVERLKKTKENIDILQEQKKTFNEAVEAEKAADAAKQKEIDEANAAMAAEHEAWKASRDQAAGIEEDEKRKAEAISKTTEATQKATAALKERGNAEQASTQAAKPPAAKPPADSAPPVIDEETEDLLRRSRMAREQRQNEEASLNERMASLKAGKIPAPNRGMAMDQDQLQAVNEYYANRLGLPGYRSLANYGEFADAATRPGAGHPGASSRLDERGSGAAESGVAQGEIGVDLKSGSDKFGAAVDKFARQAIEVNVHVKDGGTTASGEIARY